MLMDIKAVGCWPLSIHGYTYTFINIYEITDVKFKNIVLWGDQDPKVGLRSCHKTLYYKPFETQHDEMAKIGLQLSSFQNCISVQTLRYKQ